MTPAHSITLAPRVAPWLPPGPTEAELLAIDRCHALAKEAGVLDRLRDLRALLQQIKEESLDDPDMSYGGSD